MSTRATVPALADCAAVLFDLDGVLTPTAEVHMRAWRGTFEPLLAAAHGVVPYADEDYFRHLDGKPRYDGVAALLASRRIALPWGDPHDPADAPTVCGVGNRKNAEFTRLLAGGVTAYPGSVALLDALRGLGRPLAVVSSSKNAREVLRAADLADRFELVVDGVLAAAEGLPGKPAPDTFLRAAAALGAAPAECAVVEDAIGGVAAGAAGGFGLVIGVDRGAGAVALTAAGADLVVSDLQELVPGLAGQD